MAQDKTLDEFAGELEGSVEVTVSRRSADADVWSAVVTSFSADVPTAGHMAGTGTGTGETALGAITAAIHNYGAPSAISPASTGMGHVGEGEEFPTVTPGRG